MRIDHLAIQNFKCLTEIEMSLDSRREHHPWGERCGKDIDFGGAECGCGKLFFAISLNSKSGRCSPMKKD